MSGAVERLNESSRESAQRRFSSVEKSRNPKSTGFFTFSARSPSRNTQAQEVSIVRSAPATSQSMTVILLPLRGRGTAKRWRGPPPRSRRPRPPSALRSTSPEGGRESASWEQPARGPGFAHALEDEALVQPERTVAPELDLRGREPESRPMRGARHRPDAKPQTHFGDAPLERQPIG